MKYYLVDAFVTDRPFSGNPAAVCVVDSALSTSWMQSLASEFNLSETAYLEPLAEGRWGLRWFTPQVEVDLCGHATLAAAHALWESGTSDLAQLEFTTRSGKLSVTRQSPGLAMSFPRIATAPIAPAASLSAPAPSLSAIVPGLKHAVSAGDDLLVELADHDAVAGFVPDFAAIAALPCRGLIVTAAGEQCDVVSRFFAPGVGIDEDPVTGSAHCALADYWSPKLGKLRLTAMQLSRRGGAVEMTVSESRVELRGRAVTVASGTVNL